MPAETSILRAATHNGMLWRVHPPNKQGLITHTMMDPLELLQSLGHFLEYKTKINSQQSMSQSELPKKSSVFTCRKIQVLLCLLQVRHSQALPAPVLGWGKKKIPAQWEKKTFPRHMHRACKPRHWNQEGEHCAAHVANKSGLILRMSSGESDPGTMKGMAHASEQRIEAFREGEVDFRKVIQPIHFFKNQCNPKFCGFS